LHDGPVLVTELQECAEREGHAWRTVERAKKELNVRSIKNCFDGKREWRLPEASADIVYLHKVANEDRHEDRHAPPTNKVAVFDESGGHGETKTAIHDEDRQNIVGGVLADFGGDAFLPGTLVSAAVTACKGLMVDPHQFLAELSPDDHHEIVTDAEQASAFAESLSGRLS
jgi:hypothetical protein